MSQPHSFPNKPYMGSIAIRLCRIGGRIICAGLGFFIIMIAGYSSAASSGSQAIQYFGLVTKSVVDANRAPRGQPDICRFEARIQGDAYRISCECVSGLAPFEEVVGSEGTDCYVFREQWPSWSEKAASAHEQDVAEVTSGLYPGMATPENELLWMLLAGGEHVTDGEPVMLSHIVYAPEHALKAKVQYEGGWLKAVEMQSLGVALFSGKEESLPRPFNDTGYKLWDFFAKPLTNQNGIMYPPGALFSQYSVFDIPGTDMGEQRMIRRIEITVTNTAQDLKPLDDYRPVVNQKRLIVEDFRYSQHLPRADAGPVDIIQYPLIDGKWRGRNDAKVKVYGASIEAHTSYESPPLRSFRGRAFIVALFVLATVVPVSVLVRLRLKQKQQK